MTDRATNPANVEYGELPELTRALRAMGSSRRGGGDLQVQFFQPLIGARKRAADARSAASCVHAFDPSELVRSLNTALERIVSQWPDSRASARRALRAELQERVSGYLRALTQLGEQSKLVLAADEDTKLDAWRRWTAQLASTFDAADRSWLALRSVVEKVSPSP